MDWVKEYSELFERQEYEFPVKGRFVGENFSDYKERLREHPNVGEIHTSYPEEGLGFDIGFAEKNSSGRYQFTSENVYVRFYMDGCMGSINLREESSEEDLCDVDKALIAYSDEFLTPGIFSRAMKSISETYNHIVGT